MAPSLTGKSRVAAAIRGPVDDRGQHDFGRLGTRPQDQTPHRRAGRTGRRRGDSQGHSSHIDLSLLNRKPAKACSAIMPHDGVVDFCLFVCVHLLNGEQDTSAFAPATGLRALGS